MSVEDMQETPPARPWYRRLPRWAWALIAAGVLLLVLVIWLLLRRPEVALTRVERGQAISAVYAPGTVISPTETVMASTASGTLTAVLVQRGSRVQPGQVVARVDDTDARNAVAIARADLENARAQLPQARAEVEAARARVQTAREQVAVARARLASAQAQLTSARDYLTRQRFLYENGAIPRRQLIEAETAVRTAEAAVAENQANVDVAQQQVREAESGVTQAQAGFAQVNAQVEAAQASLNRAEDALADYSIRSRVAGTVSEVPVDVGDFVSVGTPVARVVDLANLYIEADVDETDIGDVAVGQRVYFVSDADPDRTFEGRVTEIGASADPATNTYPVEIRNIENPTGLRVGLSVDVNIVTRQDRDALLAPASAVILEPEPHVWMVDATSRLVYRAVEVGARDTSGRRVELTSGVAEGDLVVRNPQPGFRKGQRVRVRR